MWRSHDMRFLIYVPMMTAGEPENPLDVAGLSVLKDGADVQRVSDGPDGAGGLLLGWFASGTFDVVGYEPRVQSWTPSIERRGNRPLYWVGIINGRPPTEEGLRRPDHRGGRWVKMNHSDFWLIPTTSTMERFPRPSADGAKISWCVEESLAWVETEFDKRKSGINVKTTPSESGDGDDVRLTLRAQDDADFALLVRLLQINYRITTEVVCALELVSDQVMHEIFRSVWGLPDLIISGDDDGDG